MRNLLPLSYGSTEEATVAVVIIDTASSGEGETKNKEEKEVEVTLDFGKHVTERLPSL